MKKQILSALTIALVSLSLVNTGCKKDNADETKPVITIVGPNPYFIQKSTTWADPGATATDDVDGALLAQTSDHPTMSTTGSYTITYFAKDKSGNQMTATRTVYVVDINRTGVTAVDESPYVTGGVPQGTLFNYIEPSITMSADGTGKVTVQKFGAYANGIVNFYLKNLTTIDVPTTGSITCGSGTDIYPRKFVGSGTLNGNALTITFTETNLSDNSTVNSQDRYTL